MARRKNGFKKFTTGAIIVGLLLLIVGGFLAFGNITNPTATETRSEVFSAGFLLLIIGIVAKFWKIKLT